MTAHSFIRLAYSEHGQTLGNYPITDWPPPEDMWLISTLAWGDEPQPLALIATSDLAQLPAPDDADEWLVLTPLRQASISKLDDETAAHPHLARGALYVLEGA